MTAIPEPISSTTSRICRARLVVLTTILCAALVVAFVVGRQTAPRAEAHGASLRPLHLTASVRSADGQRRLKVMRKMNRLGAHADGE